MPKIEVKDPQAFLQEYGLEISDTSTPDEKICLCPFHDDSNPSCQINVDKQVFRCPSCKATGDLIDLVACFMKVKRATIIAHIDQMSDDGVEPVDPKMIVSWHNILMANKAGLDVLKNRKGILPKTVKDWMLGQVEDRYSIPIPSGDGRYINVRKWSPTDKVRKMTNLRGHGRRTLFPIKMLEKDTIILAEGEFKALLLIQMGFNAISPTGGASTWSPSWNLEFKDKVVYIMYDIDNTGKTNAQMVARNLHPVAKEVRIINLPIDPGEYPTGDITDFVVHLNMGREEVQDLLDKSEVWKPAPLKNPYDDDPEIYQVPLHQTSLAKFYHKRVRTSAVVSAKDTAPYVIPRTAEVECPRDQAFCHLCPVYNQPTGVVDITIEATNPAILSFVGVSNEKIPSALKKAAGIPGRCEMCRFNIKDTQNVEEARLIPEIRIKNDSEEEGAHVVRKAFYVGHGLDTNTPYEFEARSLPEPTSQHATLLIYKADAAMDSLSTFTLDESMKSRLMVFKPKAMTVEGIKAKLDELYDDLEANVTRIYKRRDLHIFFDLVYHSVLRMTFQGRIIRGWMEGLCLGDSGQGKSETGKNLMAHYQLGEKIDSKGATVAGLMGGVQETSKRWFVTWGMIPLNDRRLVILEEVKGMPTAVIEKLTDMRSSGVAELAKIEKARTNARTRLIWISNPRSDQQVAAYNFGIYAIKELVGALEDVRRFDLAIIVASGDVPSEVLNIRDKQRPVHEHVHTSELCRDLVLWAWSRKSDNVRFTDEATEAVLQASERLGKKYVANIPLVEAADQRLKMARMAAALAARTFSTEDGENLVVHEAHVKFVEEYLDRVYSTPSFGYAAYSELIRGETTLIGEDNVLSLLMGLPNARDASKAILDWQGFSIMDWMDVTEHDKDEARMALSVLVRNNAIKRGRGGLYYKTPAFIDLLKNVEKKVTLPNLTKTQKLNKEGI